MIDLLPSYSAGIGTPWSHPLATAHNYVRSRNATRWHRARSAHAFADKRVAYSYWCGSGTPYGLGQETIPRRDLLCATCEGRWRAQGPGRTIFTPLSSLPPTKCPGSRRYLVPASTRGRFPCPVCGAEVRLWAGHHSAVATIVAHRPGPSLIDPCPHHGWFRLRMGRQGRVVCACSFEEASGVTA